MAPQESNRSAELESLSPAERQYCIAKEGDRVCDLFEIYPEINDFVTDPNIDRHIQDFAEDKIKYYRKNKEAPEEIDKIIKDFIGGYLFPHGPGKGRTHDTWNNLMESQVVKDISIKKRRLNQLREMVQPKK